jgi:hypothetical protein
MLGLADIDALETAGHSFIIKKLEKVYDFWVCQMIVDGKPRREFIEPHQNIVEAGIRPYTYEFESYMKSQSLSMPEVNFGA